MALNINQFRFQPIQGLVDLLPSAGGTVSGIVDSSSNGGLVAGQAVKLVNTAGGIPNFVEVAADTDDIFGFIAYSLKDATFAVGDKVEVIGMRNGVMYMTASAAVACWDKIMVVVASKKVATATSGKTIVGRALDKASADGDLIRVIIDLPGSAA